MNNGQLTQNNGISAQADSQTNLAHLEQFHPIDRIRIASHLCVGLSGGS